MVEINLQAAWERALREFAAGTPARLAEAAGARLMGDNLLELPVLAGSVQVGYPEGRFYLPGGGEPDLRTRILILHYLAQASGEPLTGRWISFRELPGGSLYLGPFTQRAAAPLVAAFGRDPQGLARAAAALGGRPWERGEVGRVFSFFPRVPVALAFYAADEEFGAQANFLFDGAAASYLPTEDYVVLAQLLGRELVARRPGG